MTKYVKVLDHKTSVKTISIIKEPSATELGLADFKFNPVFSVFDVGTIVPPVPLDNTTIAIMAGFNFELLQKEGVPTHYDGMVHDGELISAKDAIKEGLTPDTLRFKLVNVLKPRFADGRWDYGIFENPSANNHVIPLELITRNKIGKSSSVWKRVARGEITLAELGIPEDIKPGDPLPKPPVLDYSTKYEPEDRYFSPKVSQKLAHLSDDTFEILNGVTRNASQIMTAHAASVGFDREDGKVEQVTYIDENGIRVYALGDCVCTWHEDRLLYKGQAISKQLIRDKIAAVNPAWKAEIDRAKDEAKAKGVENWKTLINPAISYNSPSKEFFQAYNALARAATNKWIGSVLYLDDINLEQRIGEFKAVA
jgi:phosphoribosylaminoimidazole-succinocarboxamide synthase